MSDAVRLVRHPAAKTTESLYGYILRLTEENGYPDWSSIFLLANIPRHERGTAHIQVSQLAEITNQPEQALELIRYTSPGMSVVRCRLLAHPLAVTDLRLKTPQICPDCVEEKGYIEAHFDLSFMMGCPIHQKTLLSVCPKCLQPLSWARPALLQCHCGAFLPESTRTSLSQPEVTLLDIIRRRVLGEPDRVYHSGLPTRELQSLTLDCLIQLINTLGRSASERSTADLVGQEQVVKSATQTLDEWPKRFIQHLEQLYETLPSGESLRMTQEPFHKIYWLAAVRIRPQENADFLRNVLSDFSALHGGRFFSGRASQRKGAEHARKFISIREFARQHCIAPRTAARYVDTGQIPSVASNQGNVHRRLIDSRCATLPLKDAGKIYRMENAAKLIGIPLLVLRALKANGEFECRHLPNILSGLHELDVASFIQRLLSLAPTPARDHFNTIETIQLRDITRSRHGLYSPITVKTLIIQQLLSKQLPVIGCVDGTPGGLLISVKDVQTCIRDNSAVSRDRTVPVTRVLRPD